MIIIGGILQENPFFVRRTNSCGSCVSGTLRATRRPRQRLEPKVENGKYTRDQAPSGCINDLISVLRFLRFGWQRVIPDIGHSARRAPHDLAPRFAYARLIDATMVRHRVGAGWVITSTLHQPQQSGQALGAWLTSAPTVSRSVIPVLGGEADVSSRRSRSVFSHDGGV